MLMMKERRPRNPDVARMDHLRATGSSCAVSECEEHGWMQAVLIPMPETALFVLP